jgi:hypothetical protein
MMIPLPSWLFFITAFMILQARETIKGAEDVEGDKLRDVRTIARVYGYGIAAGVAALLNFIGVACYMLIWLLGFASYDLWILLVLGVAVVGGAGIAPLTGPSNKKRLLIGSRTDCFRHNSAIWHPILDYGCACQKVHVRTKMQAMAITTAHCVDVLCASLIPKIKRNPLHMKAAVVI